MRTQVQRACASASVRSALRPDPSNSSLGFSSGKYDTAATNTEKDPEQTPLAAVASIHPSSSSTYMDIDAAREDDPSAVSSTKSRTHATEVHRASSSAFDCHHAASSAPSCPVASSKRSANKA
jgi:hypothetical protein